MGVKGDSNHDRAEALRAKCWAACRKEKGEVLDQFVEVTGYHRKYAISPIRKGKIAKKTGQARRGRAPVHGLTVLRALQVAAEATGWICGNRLASFLTVAADGLP